MAMLLIAGAATVVITNHKQIDEINIFALVLLVQSLPFVAAVAIATLEGSRFNEFAYWRRVEEKMARALSARAGNNTADNPSVGNVLTPDRYLSRQRRLHQLRPIRRPERDGFVVEVVCRMMQSGAIAVADEDEGARARFQHEGEILRAHDGRELVSTRSVAATSAATDAAKAACARGSCHRIVAAIVEFGGCSVCLAVPSTTSCKRFSSRSRTCGGSCAPCRAGARFAVSRCRSSRPETWQIEITAASSGSMLRARSICNLIDDLRADQDGIDG